MALEDRLLELAAEIPPLDETAAEEARKRHLGLTKPPGSLGRLEELGSRLGTKPKNAEITVAFAGAGLVLMILAGALSTSLFRRLP